jgi:membrane associated rhomboid family serine protease
MENLLIYEILEKPISSSVISVCSMTWFFIQKRGIGYADVGVSYETTVEGGQYWQIITSVFSHICWVHLVFNMRALWSLGVVEQLG